MTKISRKYGKRWVDFKHEYVKRGESVFQKLFNLLVGKKN